MAETPSVTDDGRMPTPDDTELARYDVMIVPGKPGFKCSKHGVKALLSNLAMTQLMVPRSEHAEEEWTEIYLEPDLFAHHVFLEGNAPAQPIWQQAVLRVGQAPCELAYGDPGWAVYVYLEILGSTLETPHTEFMDRLNQILYLHPKSYTRAHVARNPPADAELSPPADSSELLRRAAVSVVEYDPYEE
ncbi:MAG: hypothetical protein ACI9MR_004773 [Myxococcota bacterium]|jgi:hypothetical protein